MLFPEGEKMLPTIFVRDASPQYLFDPATLPLLLHQHLIL